MGKKVSKVVQMSWQVLKEIILWVHTNYPKEENQELIGAFKQKRKC